MWGISYKTLSNAVFFGILLYTVHRLLQSPNTVNSTTMHTVKNTVMDTGKSTAVLKDVSLINSKALSLTSSLELIEELACIHQDIAKNYIGKYNKAILLDMANIENKGDPAITLGELNLLAKLNISLLNYCYYTCSKNNFSAIRHMIDKQHLTEKDVVVLSSGGGNFGGYRYNDYQRAIMLQIFPEFDFILLAQSTWFDFDNGTHLKFVQKAYASHKHFTAFLRDTHSLEFTCEHFPTLRSILAPDMAFNIGPVPRFFPPMLDVIWINRQDAESPGEMRPTFPEGVDYVIMDWFSGWPSPCGQNTIDTTYMMTYNGFLFLQRGKVLITDRLHGHILAVLLDIPTVIIDNRIHKILNFRDTWTKKLRKVVMASNAEDAVKKAMDMLERLKGACTTC